MIKYSQHLFLENKFNTSHIKKDELNNTNTVSSAVRLSYYHLDRLNVSYYPFFFTKSIIYDYQKKKINYLRLQKDNQLLHFTYYLLQFACLYDQPTMVVHTMVEGFSYGLISKFEYFDAILIITTHIVHRLILDSTLLLIIY